MHGVESIFVANGYRAKSLVDSSTPANIPRRVPMRALLVPGVSSRVGTVDAESAGTELSKRSSWSLQPRRRGIPSRQA